MKYISYFSAVLMLSFIFLGCNIINPAEKTPTYVHIDSFQFKGNYKLGTSSHKITNVTVILDNNIVGIFDLPATVPVLADKKGVLAFTPGITYSGLDDIQIAYPFYYTDTMTLMPEPGKTITAHPTTGYYSDTILTAYQEDFEGSNSLLLITGDDTCVRTDDPNMVFEGDYSGHIHTNNENASELVLSNAFTLPQESYLEMNYKNTVPFVVGLQVMGSSSSDYVYYFYGFKPSDNWNKVYIGLQDILAQNPGTSYRIVIKVSAEEAVEGDILLDNLKVIYRKS